MGDLSRTLATEDAFKGTLDRVFPRLVALQNAGYKTSLVVDAEQYFYRSEGYLKVQNFEYTFTPKIA
jgi:hypothetical protein